MHAPEDRIDNASRFVPSYGRVPVQPLPPILPAD